MPAKAEASKTDSARSAAARKAWQTIRYNREHGIAPGSQKKSEPAPIAFRPTIALVKLPKNVSGPEDGIAARAMCLNIEFGLFGNSKQISTDSIQVVKQNGKGTEVDEKIEKSRLRAQKRLLNSPELDAIRTFDYQTRKHIRTASLKYDTGLDMIPLEAVPAIDEWLETRAQERSTKLVPAFVAAYPAACEAASKELGSQHRPEDYAPANEVADEFLFRWNWVHFGVPGTLKALKSNIWKRETEKAQQKMETAALQMQLALRQSMLELVQHMADRLTPDPDGKRKTFHASTVQNLVDFLSNFDFRNITGDAELAKVVKKAKSLLEGVDVNELKSEGAVLSKVQSGIEQISTTLDNLVVKTSRKFSKED